jgi:hypothetical protein
MDPTNTTVWTRKSFIGSVVSCRVDFEQNLGWNYRHWTSEVNTISVATDSPKDTTNRNQPLLFFQMDPTNTTVWTTKSFIGSVVSCRVDFEQNLGWNWVMDFGSQHNFCGHWQPQGQTNRNQPFLFFQMDPTNTTVWTWRSFIGSVVSCRVDFWAKLGFKLSIGFGSQHNFSGHWQPQGHNKWEPTTLIRPNGSNKHHCMDFIGSVVSCRVDVEQNLGWNWVMDFWSQHNFCGHWQPQGHNKQESTTLILPYGSNKHHWINKYLISYTLLRY